MVGKDPNSAANFDDVIVRHIDLNWTVSFEEELISGSAIYHIEFLADVDHIIFDGHSLSISSIESKCNATYLIEDNKVLGQKIIIKFGRVYSKGERHEFLIKYRTSTNANALQFVNSEFTADKVAPFLYSQCQAIHARSIVPCMDTPKVKQTYNASVTVPSNLTCLMSALSDSNVADSTDGFTKTFKFVQPIVIPSYLIAIVVGMLERRDISERCAIWAEPSIVDTARNEFIQTEEILCVAENLMGEYVWQRYDMVVMPPFFPYGGMENPMLTFLTPTIIAGDRSMVNVIAHEICHSWTGNLVTNASWECFWLNEGFTKFMEQKVMGLLNGEKFRQFLSYCDWFDNLTSTVNDVFSPTHEYTKLTPNLSGVDPDDYFSAIPYVKGSSFLLLLEQRLGGAEVFNPFIRAYIAKFVQKSVTVQDFLDYLYEYFVDKKAVLDDISIEKWLNEPGMPPEMPVFDTTLITKCRTIADKWIKGSTDDLRTIDANEFVNLHPDELANILCTLDQQVELFSIEKLALMEEKLKISELKNYDVQKLWIALALRNKYQPVVPLALDFIRKFGRLKYVKIVYRRLFAWDDTRDVAIEEFNKNKKIMHPISVYAVKSLLPQASSYS